MQLSGRHDAGLRALASLPLCRSGDLASNVFIVEDHRGKGLAKWLVTSLFANPGLQKVCSWLLQTREAKELYAKFGFEPLPHPERFMWRSGGTVAV
jgi:GNAT superfamily N-acetyltransferase